MLSAKVIQKLANLSDMKMEENYLIPLNILERYQNQMKKFLDQISVKIIYLLKT